MASLRFEKALVFALVFGFAAFVNCSNVTACESSSECNNGQCKEGVCACSAGYISYNDEVCNYKQKPKLVAFLLSIFAGTLGADWFYLAEGNRGYIIAGVFKLLSGVIGICGPCCFFLFSTCFLRGSNKPELLSKRQGLGLCGMISVPLCAALLALGQTAWWFADW
jgi:hypothetical protein